MKSLIAFIFLNLLVLRLAAQCNEAFDSLRLEINTDVYWNEVSWKITDYQTQFLLATGNVPNAGLQTHYYCVPKTGCFQFEIFDLGGDGILPQGKYRLYLKDSLIFVGNPGFGDKETFVFGCPPGVNCSSAWPIDTGSYVTSFADAESWYAFTPASNGLYQIETCSDSNTCPSKIWLYENCSNALLSENLTGAIFYGEDGCTNGVKLQVALQGGKTYYLRIRYAYTFCDGTPLHFGVHYDGAIIGCTDPLACNYNPLATVQDTCLYVGNPNCPQGPDLAIDQDFLRETMAFGYYANADACTTEEGCVRGTGERQVIYFSTRISNIGALDFFVGQTPADPSIPSDRFFWDACHNHWHYRGYAEYILYDENGVKIPIGTKNGFCILDLSCQSGASGKYTCINMGITAGCQDMYAANLPCQWIDITGLPAGKYNLVNRVNWNKLPDALGRKEFSYANNWALACFELKYNGLIPSVEFFSDCTAFVDCTGEVYGEAQPDCEGICNGSALVGDWNKDTIRNQTDIDQYLLAAIENEENTSPCKELSGDNGLDVYDAALLQECITYAQDLNYWGLKTPCLFPSGFDNTTETVLLSINNIDTLAKTVDIQMNNYINPQIGFQCSLSGLVIDSLENLAPNYNPVLHFNKTTGEILGLSRDASAINKSFAAVPFLRVYYRELTDATVCIDTIRAVVNAKYQKVNGIMGFPQCIYPALVATQNLQENAYEVVVSPNPFSNRLHFYFQTPENDPFSITIKDINGRIVKRLDNLQGDQSLELSSLPSGIYWYEIKGNKRGLIGKICAM
jgi:Lysyl oxidase/Secretion system C-terminal sorting domain